MNTICLNKKFSTTRIVTTVIPTDAKLLFLALTQGRKGEGGLRKQGYFKNNYKKVNNDWYIDEGRNIEKLCLDLPILPQGNYLPLITVITVVFNGVSKIEETINSVIEQNYDNVEYIIIDGGSTDGTIDLLRERSDRIDYWISEKDNGIYDAFNKACALVTGKWILFLGADDTFYSSNALNLFSKKEFNKEVEIVYGKVLLIDVINNSKKILNDKVADSKYNSGCAGRPMLPHHQGVFHSNSLLKQENPFSLNYKISSDARLMLFSFKRTAPVYLNEIIACAPVGGVSSKPFNFIKIAIEAFKINYELNIFFKELPKEIVFLFKMSSKFLISILVGENMGQSVIFKARNIRNFLSRIK